MFRLEMLPAAHGDCLWIEYGSGDEVHRILIDGGPAHTYPRLRERILHLPVQQRHFDLLVITHVDGDHIEGVIRLLLDAQALQCHFDRIWFNGREQLNAIPDPAGHPLGGLQGEVLGLLLTDLAQRTGQQVWNTDFGGGPVVIAPTDANLPSVTLPGDCRLTLLSPDHERLLDLKDRWADELKKAGLRSGDAHSLRTWLDQSRNLRPLGDVLGNETGDALFDSTSEPEEPLDDVLGRDTGEAGASAPFGIDASRANGSSIALLLTYPAAQPQVRVVLAGDAWASVLQASLQRLLPVGQTRLTVDAFKLSHHGSVANISPELLQCLACRHYLVSTSGAIFQHPHARALELLLSEHAARGRPVLHFNHRTPTTQAWADAADQLARKYTAVYPAGLSLALD